MRYIFGVSEVWYDPPPKVTKGGALLLGVLLMEVAAWGIARTASIDPVLVLGITRSAEAVLLMCLGPWRPWPLKNRQAAIRSLLLALTVSAVGVTGLFLWTRVFHLPTFGLFHQNILPPSGAALFLFTTSIASPVAEELVFRGLLYRSIRVHLPMPLTTILVSGGFALLHLLFGGAFLLPFIGGILFCAGYEKEKTIWAPVLLHVFGNWIIFLSPLWLA